MGKATKSPPIPYHILHQKERDILSKSQHNFLSYLPNNSIPASFAPVILLYKFRFVELFTDKHQPIVIPSQCAHWRGNLLVKLDF